MRTEHLAIPPTTFDVGAVNGYGSKVSSEPVGRVRVSTNLWAVPFTESAPSGHIQVKATWGVYQRMVAAYRHPDLTQGRATMVALIESLTTGVPKVLTELRRFGRTIKQRAVDVLAYFDRPGTSNGPTEVINGRLEHLRESAPGFRNLTN